MCPSSPFPCLCAQCLCLSTYLLIWAPASHTQTCLKPLEGGSKCVVNAFQRLVKCLQPSVYRNNVLLPLQAPLVWNTSLVIWNSHPLSQVLVLEFLINLVQLVRLSWQFLHHKHMTPTFQFLVHCRQRVWDYAVQWMKCVQSPAWKKDQERASVWMCVFVV